MVEHGLISERIVSQLNVSNKKCEANSNPMKPGVTISLEDVELEFGPKPFRIFDVWMGEIDFGHVVEEAWKKEVKSTRPDCRFRDKLKNVKSDLRKWSKERFEGNKEKNEGYKSEAMRWELEAEKRVLNDAERAAWLEARKLLLEKENEVAGMLHQKARIKWDVKGDENSKFFYSFAKRRNNKNNIRGLMLNGIWSEDPGAIKMEVERYYKALFFEGMTIRPLFCCDRIEIFLDNEAAMLETELKEKEVWEAICGCGGDKTPGPDGFNFKFMKKFWDVLKSDLMFAVKWY
ncbi:hypothetical protein Tco_1414893 [Tanacetum coccineum]